MAISAKLIRALQRAKVNKTFVSQKGYTVRIQMQIDASGLKRGIDNWENAILFQTGGWVRTRIRRSMERGKRGRRARYKRRPPFKWRGLLHDLVLFDVDLQESTVSWGVGRVRTASRARKGMPRVLEEGGIASIEQIVRRRSDERGYAFIRKRVKYRRFPYIEPQKRPAVEFMKRKVQELEL